MMTRIAAALQMMMNFYCSEKHDKQIGSTLIEGQDKTNKTTTRAKPQKNTKHGEGHADHEAKDWRFTSHFLECLKWVHCSGNILDPVSENKQLNRTGGSITPDLISVASTRRGQGTITQNWFHIATTQGPHDMHVMSSISRSLGDVLRHSAHNHRTGEEAQSPIESENK
jgi:hypothetical protein